jgi:large subunit ribosomal protein L1
MAQSKAAKVKEAEIEERIEVAEDPVVETKAIKDKTETEAEPKTTSKATAKAGKRSAKSVKEAEDKQSKEERKTSNEETSSKPGVAIKTTSKLERKGKNFRKSAEQIEKDKLYTLKEAIKLAKTTSPVKFDATVELHINLGVDPRHADQNVRDSLVLPSGTGKTLTIAVLTDDAAAAKAAGADIAGNEEFLAQLEKGQMNFDVLIATPTLMSKLGKYARVLGPRGLMPNPKSGTVTTDVVKAVGEAKAGRVEYRVDTTGIVHLGIGKVSFSEDALDQNIQAIVASIKSNKPSSLKGTYVKAVYISTSMGPSIKVETSDLN